MISRSFRLINGIYKYLFTAILISFVFTYAPRKQISDITTNISDGVSVSELNTDDKYLENIVEAKEPLFHDPKKLSISKINLITDIEILGLDENRLMAIPDEGKSVSWFKYGPKPGETGNSVIGGHYDTKLGPAVFYRLREVEIGDTVLIENDQGKGLIFEIYNKQVVETEDFNVQEIYGPNPNRNLILITCHGRYTESLGTYNQRLILFARYKP